MNERPTMSIGDDLFFISMAAELLGMHPQTLRKYERLGLIRHTHLGPGAATYHAGDDRGHLHLVCESCGTVTEASSSLAAGLVGRLRAVHGFSPDVEHMAISGTCADCTAKAAGPDADRPQARA